MLPSSTVYLYATLREAAFGIFMIGLVLGVNGFINVSMIHLFRSSVGTALKPSKLRATFFFIICTQVLAFAQLGAITIWAIALLLLELSPDWISAVRLSASSYTTLGDFPGTLPDGWHLTPAFIAFSGLFSFSWAASSTISMVNSLNLYLDTNKGSNDESIS
jgi:hypothetical protein